MEGWGPWGQSAFFLCLCLSLLLFIWGMIGGGRRKGCATCIAGRRQDSGHIYIKTQQPS